MSLRWLCLLLCCWSLQAQADLSQFQFADQAEEQRFRALLSELRCLVCQNQSLEASDAELAQDLRREAYQLMQAGHDDATVMQFLVDRYGDFVLYRPPFKPSTYFLWLGPVVIFLGLAVVVIRGIKQQTRVKSTLSPEQRAQAQALLSADKDQE